LGEGDVVGGLSPPLRTVLTAAGTLLAAASSIGPRNAVAKTSLRPGSARPGARQVGTLTQIEAANSKVKMIDIGLGLDLNIGIGGYRREVAS
jgi:hypothetical protein